MLCLLALAPLGYGQQADTVPLPVKKYHGGPLADSLRASFKKKPKLVFRWDSHGSFITNTPARMTALGAGLRFGDYIKLGLSVDFLNSGIYRIKTVPNEVNGALDSVKAKLNYGMVSIYSNFLVARHKKWEFTVPVAVGIGASSYSYTDIDGKNREMAKGGMMSINSMFMAEYKVFKWLGVGAGLGLRLVPISNNLMKENFNSMLWDANLSVYFGEIYRSISTAIKKKKEAKNNPKFRN